MRPSQQPANGPAPTAAPAQAARTPAVQKLVDEAAALTPMAESDLGRRFLNATASLPSVATRIAYRDDNSNTRDYYSPQAAAALGADKRAKLTRLELDESRYYNTKYGSPTAYLRALDLLAAHGFGDVSGKRILDFGYGSIGHLRLLASLGADMTGVDVDPYLEALYSEASDQGRVPAASGWLGHAGSITLAHGSFPKDPRVVSRVGGDYDLIVSKNTLKRGYIHPDPTRKVNKNQVIDLGVPDGVFLQRLHDLLRPGGYLLIYNLSPKPSAPNETYRPWSDGHSPFTREQYEKAGLRVLSFDAEDHAKARRMGHILGWDRDEKGEVTSYLDADLFALYTLVQRPAG